LSLRESIELALAAATAADTASDRPAILRAALAALSGVAGEDDLRAEISRRLQVEVAADAAYATLATQLATLAEAAMRRGDVKGVEATQTQLAARDLALGLRRPQEVKALAERLQAALARARAHRAALDHFVEVGARLYRYERDVQPVLSRSTACSRSGTHPGFEIHVLRTGHSRARTAGRSEGARQEDRSSAWLGAFIRRCERDLMALQACDRRRQVDVGPNPASNQEAATPCRHAASRRKPPGSAGAIAPPKFQ
jgi:hypothetical protein